MSLTFICAICKADGDTTNQLIRQASSLYNQLEFEEAVRLLNNAYKQPGNSSSQLVQIHNLLGLCFSSLSKYKKAKKSFARLLALEPNFRLSPKVSPRVRIPFDELVENSPSPFNVKLSSPDQLESGSPMIITLHLISNPVSIAKKVYIWHRRANQEKYSSAHTRLKQAGEYQITIPATLWESQGQESEPVLWYVSVENEFHGQLFNFGKASRPLVLDVVSPQKQIIAEESASKDSWYKKWWVWTIIGGVIAGATTSAILLTTDKDSGPVDFPIEFSYSE
jgi:tetratricopeptide (TPR) repeat protein